MRNDQTARLPVALGWLSVGLGVPPLISARRVTDLVGVGSGAEQRGVAAFVGVRELASAAGLFSSRLRPQWIWTRVAGDAMDLAVFGKALKNADGRNRSRVLITTMCIAGITAVDVYAALTRAGLRGSRRMQLTGTTTVGKSPQEVYTAWRQLDRLPSFMAHVEKVDVTGAKTSHWRATAPLGRGVEWNAVITEDEPDARLSWKSVDGSPVPNSGTVDFVEAPGGRGTEVHVHLTYELPGGKAGELAARYFGEDPHQQVDDDLRRFKQIMETGEVVRSEGAPSGKRARREFPQRPAQPLAADEFEQEVLA